MRQSRHLGLGGLHDYVMEHYILVKLTNTYRFNSILNQGDYKFDSSLPDGIARGGDGMSGNVDGHQTIKETGLIGNGKDLIWVDDGDGQGHIGYGGNFSTNTTLVPITLPKFNGYITGIDLAFWITASGGSNHSNYAWALSHIGARKDNNNSKPYYADLSRAYNIFYTTRDPSEISDNNKFVGKKFSLSGLSNNDNGEDIYDDLTPSEETWYGKNFKKMTTVAVSYQGENVKPKLFEKERFIKIKPLITNNQKKIFLFLWGAHHDIGNIHIAKDNTGYAVGVKFYYKAYHRIKEDVNPENDKVWDLDQ